LYRATRSQVKDMARQFDPPLTPMGFVVLRTALEAEPVRASAVAAALGLDKSILSRKIVVLREAGLVISQPDPDDRRATLLVSSAAARQTIATLTRRSRDEYHRVLSTWATDDIATFARWSQPSILLHSRREADPLPYYLRRRAVEPLRVIDQAYHRPLHRRLCQQAEDGQPDQEPVGRRARAHAEPGPQRLPLWTRQHPQPVQQRRLAHPRLTVHHQHPALTGTHRLGQPVQHAALGTPVRQPAHTASQPEEQHRNLPRQPNPQDMTSKPIDTC
jgi:DNA-binding MarR family transcriptional regulator